VKSRTFLIIDEEQDKIQENGRHQQIQRVKYDWLYSGRNFWWQWRTSVAM